MRPVIFVSYSHSDSHLVGPIVALFRASDALVFKDSDSIVPGKKWRDQLATAIGESHTVLVFWCQHSSQSEEVRNEYFTAIGLGKDVLPVLIDTTPLPAELAEYQYIDFREAFPAGHSRMEPLTDSSIRTRLSYPVAALLVTISFFLVVISVSTLVLPIPWISSGSARSDALLWKAGFAILVFFVFTFGQRIMLRRRLMQSECFSATDGTQAHLQMASRIIHELYKRTRANEA